MKLKLRFLSIKRVPSLFWSSPNALTFTPPLVSVLFLLIGLILFGLGEALLIGAGLGVSPWTVLAQGVSHITGWSIGFATFITSLLVLACWLPLKQIPGIGTIMNVLIIALVLEFLLPYIPTFRSPLLKIGEAIIGVLVTGFGGGLYLISNLGPGPRDGLMTGLQRITSSPIALVRSSLEISVIFIGWLLGGSVGFGTVLFALGIGPSVAASMYSFGLIFSSSCRLEGEDEKHIKNIGEDR
ncbi:MAG: hypothetical protein RMX26_02590 [Planktomarina sp.]|nr:hypothetical protein [Planktomarina sp.]|tara:strand:+ start:25 stop:747 length:723 start_codon:yes stop_codon:yes gene_type:complete